MGVAWRWLIKPLPVPVPAVPLPGYGRASLCLEELAAHFFPGQYFPRYRHLSAQMQQHQQDQHQQQQQQLHLQQQSESSSSMNVVTGSGSGGSAGNNGGAGGSNGSMTTSQACAACKFQRRKCPADCPLAPYFPAEANQRFLSCKRLFGVSNMLRFLRDADPIDKEETMKSLIYEAEVRDKDPVHGCYGIISRLADQVKVLQRELEMTRNLMQHQQHHQQQQQQQHHHQQHHHHPLLVQPELAQTLLSSVSSSCNNPHPLALPLSTAVAAAYRNSGPSLALDDPFDFESIDHKFILRP